jgi:hypothetical protein
MDRTTSIELIFARIIVTDTHLGADRGNADGNSGENGSSELHIYLLMDY